MKTNTTETTTLSVSVLEVRCAVAQARYNRADAWDNTPSGKATYFYALHEALDAHRALKEARASFGIN